MHQVFLGFIRLRAGRALLGVLGIITVNHVTNWDDVIEVFGEYGSVLPLAIESSSQALPVHIRISSIIPLIFVA